MKQVLTGAINRAKDQKVCGGVALRDKASNSTNNTIRVSVKKHLKIFLGFFRKYKDALGMLKRSRTNMESMSAAVLFIPDQSEITHLETADYRQYI